MHNILFSVPTNVELRSKKNVNAWTISITGWFLDAIQRDGKLKLSPCLNKKCYSFGNQNSGVLSVPNFVSGECKEAVQYLGRDPQGTQRKGSQEGLADWNGY